MFASVRRYRLQGGSMEELAGRVDRGFAQEIEAQPGFVSYELIDCGDGEIITISMFEQDQEAEASRDLARRWSEQHLRDLEFLSLEVLHGDVCVSRANDEMLEPAHEGAMGKFASVRRYQLRSGEVSELMHTVDQVFVDMIGAMDGFEAYHALDCGRGEIVSISMFRDQPTAEESDEKALQFVSEYLGSFDIERTEAIGGEVRVSRAAAVLLEPAHA